MNAHSAHPAGVDGLNAARFSGDLESLRRLNSDARLAELQQRADVLKRRSQLRLKLLASALRVTSALAPAVHEALEAVSRRVAPAKPLEAFVFADPSINAFVAEGRTRFLIGLSSGAVNTLTCDELEFVIGHELGHATFGHTEVSAGLLAEDAELDESLARLVRSWQRASELSADRVGLLACGSLQVATSALLKTLAGLPFDGLQVSAADALEQWEALLGEVLDDGAHELWQHSHPFPPLRIKALTTFWEHHQTGSSGQADPATAKLLGLMDGAAGAAATNDDAVLGRFVFWGALYVGLADGALRPAVRARLEHVKVPGVSLSALAAVGVALSPVALERFREALAARHNRLRAQELSVLLRRLVELASLDGRPGAEATERLTRLATALGLSPGAVTLLLQQHQPQGAAS